MNTYPLQPITSLIMKRLSLFFLFTLLLSCISANAYKKVSIDITVNGQKRNMLVFTPNTVSDNMPLMIITHGMNQNPEYQSDNDKMYELIDTEKFIVAYLRSDGNTWDVGGDKDLNFVEQTIDAMYDKYKINKKIIFGLFRRNTIKEREISYEKSRIYRSL